MSVGKLQRSRALFMRPNISRLNYFIYKLRVHRTRSRYPKTTLTTIFCRFNDVVIIIHIIIRWPRPKPNDASAAIPDCRRHLPPTDNIVIVPSIEHLYTTVVDRVHWTPLIPKPITTARIIPLHTLCWNAVASVRFSFAVLGTPYHRYYNTL